MINVSAGRIRETFDIFRSCGAGRAECVAYWIGPIERPDLVDEVIHPRHVAHAGGYDVDGPWQTRLWLSLVEERRELKAQVHTHPGRAYHSERDDRMAALQVEGFLSLVIPDFGLGEPGLASAFLVRRTADGGWKQIPADPTISIGG